MEIEKSYTAFLYAISDGSKTDMDAWGKSKVEQVYMCADIREEQITKRIEEYRKNG